MSSHAKPVKKIRDEFQCCEGNEGNPYWPRQ